LGLGTLDYTPDNNSYNPCVIELRSPPTSSVLGMSSSNPLCNQLIEYDLPGVGAKVDDEITSPIKNAYTGETEVTLAIV
jgi:hypothetical protein